jgi:hypothetical protein
VSHDHRPRRSRARHALPLAKPAATKLNLPTIMDRALAQKHGAAYVHLMAFAIDVDRVYTQGAPVDEDALLEADALLKPEALPFGWEVMLTGARLHALDGSDGSVLAMLEDSVHHVLDQVPDEQGFGSQLVFAVYDAVQRSILPSALEDLFRAWRSRPKQLIRTLDGLWRDETLLPRLAKHCLGETLDPKLAPPTAAALEQMVSERWPLHPRLLRTAL